MTKTPPNHAQRTRPSRCGCNPRVLWAGSLDRLGHRTPSHENMKTRPLLLFALSISTIVVLGAAIPHLWKKNEVTPVVLVKPSSIGGFAPVEGGSTGNTWSKDEVRPVVLVKLGIGGFVPIDDSSVGNTWSNEEVTAVVIVEPNARGFVPCGAAWATSQATGPSDAQAKQEAKAEERMKDEKQRDEQSARDHANRVKIARLDTVWRPPRTVDIEVVQPREAVSKPYKSIALLTFDCATKEETQAVAGFIAKAKDLGADGVLILGFEVPTMQRIDINERRVFRANAIIYQSPK
jgi:hypothetical protein